MRRQGYTLMELIVVVAITAVFAAVAVPRLQFGTVRKQQAQAVAWKIMTDLRRTRSLALRDAAANTKGFELEMTGSSPYTGYQIINSDTDQVERSYAVDSGVSVTCPGESKFKFGPLGNLTSGGTLIVVSANGKTCTMTIVSATGAVTFTEN